MQSGQIGRPQEEQETRGLAVGMAVASLGHRDEQPTIAADGGRQPRPPLRDRGRRAARRARDRRLLLRLLLRQPGRPSTPRSAALRVNGWLNLLYVATGALGLLLAGCASRPTRSAPAPSTPRSASGASRSAPAPRSSASSPRRQRRRRPAPRTAVGLPAALARPLQAAHAGEAAQSARVAERRRRGPLGRSRPCACRGGAARAGPGRRSRRRRRRPRPPAAPSCAGRAAPAARSRRAPRPSRRAPRPRPAVTAEKVSSSRPERRSGGSIGRSASASSASTSQVARRSALLTRLTHRSSPPAAA